MLLERLFNFLLDSFCIGTKKWKYDSDFLIIVFLCVAGGLMDFVQENGYYTIEELRWISVFQHNGSGTVKLE